MKNKTYIWVALAILGVGGYLAYKEFKKVKVLTKEESVDITKEESVDIIIENGKHKDRNISNFEDGYLKAWANAILRKESTFVYNAKTYNTQGGKSVK